MKKGRFRAEHDSLGTQKIPAGAYYGAQTQRAVDNFPISGIRMPSHLIHAIALIKAAAADANMAEGRIDSTRGRAIVRAATEVMKGQWDGQFPVDVYQAGAGTSEHMNVNEVIANRALQILGNKKGAYHLIHPNDHVNLGQSTNDVFHSAIHIAAYLSITQELLPAIYTLEKELRKKGKTWRAAMKSGRTHLRDAVPMTLGQEFTGFAQTIKEDRMHLAHDAEQLRRLNLGGTAVGTGITATSGFKLKMLREVRALTGTHFLSAPDLFSSTQSLNAIAATSSALNVLATDLIKISNDLRLLGSGPKTGLDEIELPAVQPGSSIMAGKINPAMAEMMDMIGFQVIGNNTTITLCAQAGQLELNVMMPLASYSLLHSIDILTHGIDIFTRKCIVGMKAHPDKAKAFLERNPIVVTALTPYIGYAKAAEVAKQAYREDATVKEIVLRKKLMDRKALDKALNFQRMAGLKR